MEIEHRKRLKKLKAHTPVPSNDLIPRKQNLPQIERSTTTKREEDDDSLEDFISDRVEYDRNGPPVSSEESAHSTDEETGVRKKKKIIKSSSESSAHFSDSEDLEINDSASENTPKGESQKEILVGKKALEAKRQQGLIPEIKHKKHESKRDSSEKKKKKKKKSKRVEEEKVLRKSEGKKSKDPKKYVQFSEFSDKDKKKAEMVTKVLQRWWYAMDDWPPEEYNYNEALRESNLRLVSKENWSVEPVVNEQGLEKVLALPGYVGVFLNSTGNVKDLRPSSLCPSFDNLFGKALHEIREILVKALSNQIEQLKIQSKVDKELLKELSRELAYYQRQ